MDDLNTLILPGQPFQSRRHFLQLGNSALLVSFLCGTAIGEEIKLRDAKDAVDHLVLGVSDLQKGIEWFEKKQIVQLHAA